MASIACNARNRCRRWKLCSGCAAIRQAQIANIAELGARTSRAITYAVVRPLSNDIATQKSNVLKKLKGKIDGGIWTIETGSNTAGIHTNLILGSDNPINAKDIAEALTTEASVYAEHVPHTDVRRIAAYSSKMAAFPDKHDYSGRLYGSFGTFKRPLATIVEAGGLSPILGGMALEQMLDDAGIPKPEADKKAVIRERPFSRKESWEEARERVKENDEEIERVKKENEGRGRRREHEKHMRRVMAVHKGEIELNGFVYINGYGIATKKELVKFGLCKNNDHLK